MMQGEIYNYIACTIMTVNLMLFPILCHSNRDSVVSDIDVKIGDSKPGDIF